MKLSQLIALQYEKPVHFNNCELLKVETVKYFNMHLDRRLIKKKHIHIQYTYITYLWTNKKQLRLKLT